MDESGNSHEKPDERKTLMQDAFIYLGIMPNRQNLDRVSIPLGGIIIRGNQKPMVKKSHWRYVPRFMSPT